MVARAPPGRAQVVFLRPTKTMQQVSVYLLGADQGEPQFLGVVPPVAKLAATVPPGDHLFMVVGDQEAEFMQAHLQAGDTYYALLRGRFDKNVDWHFFLLPIRGGSGDAYNLHSAAFRKWERNCRLVEKSADDDQWYAENHTNVESLRAYYISGWNQRSDASRAQLTLNAEDGVAALEPGTRQGRHERPAAAEPDEDR